MTVRVVVADDQPLVRAGVETLLVADPEIRVVAQAQNALQAVEMVRRHRPEVVTMDLYMSGRSAVDAVRTITGERVSVLVVSVRREVSEVYEAVRAGAAGFLLKGTASDNLVSAVRAVARGGGWLDPGITRDVFREVTGRPTVIPDAGEGVGPLTAREREVLSLVALGLSNLEIAARLSVAESTIKTHLARVLTKLRLRNRAQAVVAAYQTGLVRIPVPNGMSSRPVVPAVSMRRVNGMVTGLAG
jgi:DNA-binding NarL/FixJ family response regulator